MPPSLKIGSIIASPTSEYEIIRLISEGSMSWAFEARKKSNNAKIFLKYYKSPTPTVEWYDNYRNYIQKINYALEHSDASNYCILSLEDFTANPKPGLCRTEFYFQAYEFIESGFDLRSLMSTKNLSWETRKTMAKVFLVAMRKIHQAGIVHCDLKPENIQMIQDQSTKLGFIPRMIDMDRSILANEEAPWTKGNHKEGYTGTKGYFSPEHINGQTPLKGSDVFTIGIILAEILANKYPFENYINNPLAFKNAIASNSLTSKIRLIDKLGDSDENTLQFESLIELCFSPIANDRPTVEILHKELLKLDKKVGEPHLPSPNSPLHTEGNAKKIEITKEEEPAFASSCSRKYTQTLELCGDLSKFVLKMPMTMGRYSLAAISSHASFASSEQFKIDYDFEMHLWILKACENTTNLTLINGRELEEAYILKSGDIICLKGRGSNKTAMKIEINLSAP